MSQKQNPAPIPFEEFQSIIAEGLQVERGKVVREASFICRTKKHV